MSHLRFAADPLKAAIAVFSELQDARAGPCGATTVDTTSSEMCHLIRDLQLVDTRGRKYLTADERQRFLEATRLAPRPADQTFALTLAHTAARISEALAVRTMDIDIEAASIRIRTLKRRAEHCRKIPVPPELLRALKLVHALRSTPAKAAGKPLWPWSQASAHRKIAKTMAYACVEGPQACPKGLRHGFGIAAVAAGVPLPTITAALGHANLRTTAIYTTAAGLEARDFLAKTWEREANSAGSGT